MKIQVQGVDRSSGSELRLQLWFKVWFPYIFAQLLYNIYTFQLIRSEIETGPRHF